MRGKPRQKASFLGWLLLMMTWAAPGSWAVSLSIDASSFGSTLKPQPCFVGDRARLEVRISPGILAETAPGSLEEYAPSDQGPVTLRKAILDRTPDGSWKLIIDFSAFEVGTLPLPPVDVAGFSFYGLSVEIASVFVEGGRANELVPALGPLSLPGTAPLLYAILFVVLFSVVGALFFFGRGMGFIRALWAKVAFARKVGLLRRSLAALRGSSSSQDVDAIWSSLDKISRQILSLSVGEKALSLLPSELGPLVSEDAGVILSTLSRADSVRFGGTSSDAAEFTRSLAGVAAFLDGLVASRKEGSC